MTASPRPGTVRLPLGPWLLPVLLASGLAACGGSEDDDNSRTASTLGAAGLQRAAPAAREGSSAPTRQEAVQAPQ